MSNCIKKIFRQYLTIFVDNSQTYLMSILRGNSGKFSNIFEEHLDGPDFKSISEEFANKFEEYLDKAQGKE